VTETRAKKGHGYSVPVFKTISYEDVIEEVTIPEKAGDYGPIQDDSESPTLRKKRLKLQALFRFGPGESLKRSLASIDNDEECDLDSLEVPEGSRGMVRIKKKGHNRKESMASGSAYRDDGSIDSRMSGLSRKTDAKSALRLFKNHRKS